MQSVKCLGLVCAGCLGMLALASTSHSIYFTMQLKNGSEITTDYYSIDNSSIIRFYTNEGAVAIPKSIIKNIKSNDGIVTVELEESEQNRQPAAGSENEDGQKSPNGSLSEKEAAQERLSSINDQLAVINANLDNLSKNKNIFIAQKEQYAQQKRTIEERIERIKKEGAQYAGSKEQEKNIELEQAKLKDNDAKLQDMQQRIENNEKMFDAQQRIKQRFEEDLAKLKK
jgi:chromosome segregation ATPase